MNSTIITIFFIVLYAFVSYAIGYMLGYWKGYEDRLSDKEWEETNEWGKSANP